MTSRGPDPGRGRRAGGRARPLVLGVLFALVIAGVAMLVFRTFAAGNDFLDRVGAIAAETFSATVPLDRAAGYVVDDLCLVPAGADPRAIATAGDMPASALINITVAAGEVGLLMHGEGQTTFGSLPSIAWADATALARCFGGGGFVLAFDAVSPLRGGRLVLPAPSATPAADDIEVQPLPPVPR